MSDGPGPERPDRRATLLSAGLQRTQDEGSDAMHIGAEEVRRDARFHVAAAIGAAGLLALTLSPLFEWVAFGRGGVAGIRGDGRFVLGLSVAALAALGVACFTRRGFSVLVLASQAWASVATVWMGTLIWKVDAVLDRPELEDNPFAALIASQVGPGAGLYIGLVGGLLAAGALGVLVATHLHGRGRARLYYIVQATALAAGAVLAALIGPDLMSEARADDGSKADGSSAPSGLLGDTPGASGSETDPSEDPEPAVSGVVIEPKLTGKRFDEGRFQSFVSLDIEWHVAKAEKPVRAVKGRLLLQDLFDETKLALGWTIHHPARQGERFVQEGSGFEFNQFIGSHTWARSTDPADIELAFEPEAVVYQDGTAEGLGDDVPSSSILQPVLLDKEVKKRRYQTHVWMDVRWETDELPKPTRAVKGVLHLTDLFGEPRLSIETTLDEPLTPGEPYVQKGLGFEYNQFMDSHAWVRNTETDNIRTAFEPESAIYADGTRQDF